MQPIASRSILSRPALAGLGLFAGAAGLAAPAAADTVLIGTEVGTVLAYDTDTGEVAFRGVCGGPVSSMARIDQTLYLGDEAGVIYTFDLATDALTGSLPTSLDATAMAAGGGSLFVADTAGTIQRVDPVTGAVAVEATVPFATLTAVGTHWGNVYHGGLSTLAERAPLGSFGEADAFELFAICGGAINSMTFAGVNVFLGSLNGSIYRYDEFNGVYGTDHFVGADAVAMVALVGSRVLVADSGGRLLEMDVQTGAVLRETDTGARIGAMVGLDIGAACPLDLDLSGVLDLGDVQTFVMNAIESRPGADLDRDGDVDIADVGLFVDGFTAGCD